MAAGWPTKVTYANGDVYSASDVNDTNGTLNYLDPTSATDNQVLTRDAASPGKVKWAAASGAPVVAGKNGVINGGMDIWQRGTSSSGNAYICDRWYSALISGTGTFAQESTVVPSGSLYSEKFTASATAQPAIYQAVETLNAIRFANQSVTLSAKVASSTSVGFTLDVQWSTATDNGVTGTWTSITATSGGTATATSTTFVSISGVYAIPSTAKSLRVRLFTTSTIANGVVVYFGQVQMEQGTAATTFSRSAGTIQGELAACQRYYWRQTNNSANTIPMRAAVNADSSTGAGGFFYAVTTFRANPTSVEWSNLAWYRNGIAITAITNITLTQGGTDASYLQITSTGMTGGTSAQLTSNANGAYLALSAEL